MFGSHLSIAGNMANALREAESLKMDTVQVFTKNQQQWKARPLEPAAIEEWKSEVARLGWQGRTVAHASYLINLASPDETLWRKSVDLMREEIERCEALGIPFLVHHPGAATGSAPEAALSRIAAAYRELFASTRGYRTVSCLENTVGAGSVIGRTFDELARLRGMIADAAGEPGRVGYCVDTCHAHAAGYDMSTREAAAAALDEFERTCGLTNLRVLHLNDSKGPVGSRLDRHQHIGAGTIGSPRVGASGFWTVVNRPELRGVPKILETPKGDDETGKPWDAVNLARLRRLIESGKPSAEREKRRPRAARAASRPRARADRP